MNKIIRNREILGGIVFFALSLYLFYEISHFPTTLERYRSLGPAVFPKLLSWAMLFLSIALFWQGLRKNRSAVLSFKFSSPAFRSTAFIIFMLIAYIVLVDAIGIILWGMAFMIAVQVALGERRPAMIAGISVVVVGGIYGVFSTLLRVPLPGGSLFG
ncbi:MAG: tripartite tricarboxylate transporter TctB family protein [Rhodospirillales bacterium]|jgi:hypothetical protein|nr:tripartite tricarboxylate transporter TctB family protein [Rhodospirillales bacterium]